MLTSTLVCGPPGAGKTTYVNENRAPSDFVWDFDVLVEAFCPGMGVDRTRLMFGLLSKIKKAFLDFVESGVGNLLTPHIWIIDCAPKRIDRDLYRNWYRSKVILLDPGREVCISRCSLRYGAETESIVDRWYEKFEE